MWEGGGPYGDNTRQMYSPFDQFEEGFPLQNPGYPGKYNTAGTCVYLVKRMDEGVCQIRYIQFTIIFIAFIIIITIFILIRLDFQQLSVGYSSSSPTGCISGTTDYISFTTPVIIATLIVIIGFIMYKCHQPL